MQKTVRELRDQFKELASVSERETREEHGRELLREVMASISDLETAQSSFRWVMRPSSDIAETDSIRDARSRQVTARVVLEARAKELPDPRLRARVLAYVKEDEKADVR